ncbi:MAG: hypothetical protein Q9166_007856 [cf. Caloplaca sp. 2 TL-2023]
MGASLIAGVRLHALGYPTPITGNPDDPLVTLTQTNSAITTTTQIEWAFQMMQMLALGCVKLSFLFFYRRVFITGVSTWFSKATTGLIIIVLVWTVAFFFALLFACKGNWSAWWGSVMDLSTKFSLTANLYWSMVESGLGLMAVCLPTFHALFRQVSLDSLVQSFRNTFSLHSRASQTGLRSKNSVLKTELSGGCSEHFEQEHSTFETYAIREGKVENGRGRVPDGKILVQSSIGRVEDWA